MKTSNISNRHYLTDYGKSLQLTSVRWQDAGTYRIFSVAPSRFKNCYFWQELGKPLRSNPYIEGNRFAATRKLRETASQQPVN